MKLSLSAKSVLSRLLGFAGIPEAAIRNRSGKQYLILMYHRILPSEHRKPWIQAGMYVDPGTFEMHIRHLKQYFQIIPFPEKFSNSQYMEKQKSIRPICILTFDDGWQDFYEFAYPVLKRNQVPATVFLPTGYIGTIDLFWTDQLARYLGNATLPIKPEKRGTRVDSSLSVTIAGLRGSYEERLETAIVMLKRRKDTEIAEVIEWLKERMDTGTVPVERAFLSWEEVREMGRSGLVSFGSHTHNHRILVHLKEEEVRDELVRSKEILIKEGAVEPAFIPFCYPNGDLNERIAGMVREAGYHAAVTTVEGWNDGDVSPFELKRVAIHQDMSASREMFGCRVADIL